MFSYRAKEVDWGLFMDITRELQLSRPVTRILLQLGVSVSTVFHREVQFTMEYFTPKWIELLTELF